MAKGGIGQYNSNLNGFVTNNSPASDELAGWMDVVEGKSDGFKRDAIDGLMHLFSESGSFGASWGSIASNLPDSPTLGRAVVRVNADESNELRLYVYNQSSSSWEHITTAQGGGSVSTLTDLSDTNISSPSTNHVLVYNGTSNKWENTANPTIAGNVTISGDLTVSGTTTTINSTTTTIDDPIVLLGDGTTSSHTDDRGAEFKYFDSTVKTGFFGYDTSAGRFTFMLDTTNTTETISGTLGDLNVGGIYLGNGLEITHNGSIPVINDTGTGDLQFQISGTEIYRIESGGIVMNDTNVEGDVIGAIKFKAKAGEGLTKGDAVYISSFDGTGNLPVVSKADADDSNKMPSFGLAESTVSTNTSVNIVTFGTLSGLDTSSFSLGDVLYVSTTAGSLTATAPSGESGNIQNIAKVTRSHASSGSVKVGGAGRFNAVPNLNDGNIFIGNGSNQTTTASLNTKIEDYLDAGTSTPILSTLIFNSGTSINEFSTDGTLAGNSDDAVPTEKAVKTYVDTQLTAEDLDITTDSGTIAIDLDSETLTVSGGTGVSTSGATNTLTIGVNGVLEDLDTLGVPSTDGQMIVATGSGTFAYESGSTLRTSIGVDPAGTDNSTDVTLAGSLDYLTISGQEITRNAIDLSTDVTGTLDSANIDQSLSVTSLTIDKITASGNDITISETGTSDVPQIKIDSAGHGNIVIDRGSTSYDANMIFQTDGSTKWRLWLDGADTTLAIRDEAQSNDLVTFTSNSGMTVDGSISATTIGGITEANLLDKSADETVSGAYTFSDVLSISGTSKGTNYLKILGNNTTTDTFGYLQGEYSGDKIFLMNNLYHNGTTWEKDDYTKGGMLFEQNIEATDFNSQFRFFINNGTSANVGNDFHEIVRIDGNGLSLLRANSNNLLSISATANYQAKLDLVSGSTKFTLFMDADNDSGSLQFRPAGLDSNAIKFSQAGNITATSFGGITEANLLDKSDAETISGEYTFSSVINAEDGINKASGNLEFKIGDVWKLRVDGNGITLGGGQVNSVGTLSFNAVGSTSVTSILDEDTMSSDSATALATQQSIKAYVDSQVASADQLSELSDVTLTSSADGDLLRYNGSAWINTTTLNGTYTFTNDLTISKSVSTSLVPFFSLSDTSEDIFTIDAQATKYGAGGKDVFLSNMQGSFNQRLVLADGSSTTHDMFQLRQSNDGFSSVDNLVLSVTGDGDVETGGKYISDKGTATTGTFAEFKVDTDRVMSISYPIDDGGFEFDNNNYYVFKTDGGERLIIGDTFLRLPDSIELRLGQGNDFRLIHNGTDSTIVNYTGHLQIQQETDDGWIRFYSDNGSGGIEEYLRISGSTQAIYTFNKTGVLVDGSTSADFLFVGAGEDVRMFYDGSHFYVNTDQVAQSNTYFDTKSLVARLHDRFVIQDTDDSNETIFDLNTGGRTLTIGATDGNDDIATTFYGDVTVSDNTDFNGIVRLSADGSASDNFLSIGDGDDLKIYHDSNDTRIRNFTGNLVIANEGNDKDIIFQNDDNSGGTTDWIALDGSEYTTLFKVNTRHQDNINAYFGSGNDAYLKYDGSYLRINSDNMWLDAMNGSMIFDSGNDFVWRDEDDSNAELIKLNTSTRAFTIGTSSDDVYISQYGYHRIVADGSSSNNYFSVGAGDDLKIYHSGSASYINNFTNDLIFQNDDSGGTNVEYMRFDASANIIKLSKTLDLTDEEVRTNYGTYDKTIINTQLIDLSKTANLVPSDWAEDTSGSASTELYGQNGADTENSIVWGDGSTYPLSPHGSKALLWRAESDGDNASHGGFVSDQVKIDHTETYQFSVWIYWVDKGDASGYHGVVESSTDILNLDGTSNTNPYFRSNLQTANVQVGEWYLSVGYVHGSGTTGTTNYGAVYRQLDGSVATASTDFRFTTSATTIGTRAFLYYDASGDAEAFFFDPRIHLVDGSEPSPQQLLGSDPRDFVTLSTTQTITGAKTFTDNTQLYFGNSNDGNLRFDGTYFKMQSGQLWLDATSSNIFMDFGNNLYFRDGSNSDILVVGQSLITQKKNSTLLDNILLQFGSDTDASIGWVSATNTFDFRSEGDITFTLDDDNNSANGFRINNGGDSTVFTVDESGNISNTAFTIPSSIGSAGQVLRVPTSGTTLEWGTITGSGGTDNTVNANISDVITLSTQEINAVTTFGANATVVWDNSASKLTYKGTADFRSHIGLATGSDVQFNTLKLGSVQNSEYFNIEKSNSSASTPFARFRNTSNGGNSFIRFHAYTDGGSSRYGDVGIDPDDGSLLLGFGTSGATLPYSDGIGVRIKDSGAIVVDGDATFKDDVYVNGGTDNSTARIYFQIDEATADQFILYKQSNDFNIQSEGNEPINFRYNNGSTTELQYAFADTTFTIGQSSRNVDTTMYGNLTATGGNYGIYMNATGDNNSIRLDSATSYWSYIRFESGTPYADIGLNDGTESGEFQIRPSGNGNYATTFHANGGLTTQNLLNGDNRTVDISIKANQFADGTTDYDTRMILGLHTTATDVYGYLSAPQDSSTSVTEMIRFYDSHTEFNDEIRIVTNLGDTDWLKVYKQATTGGIAIGGTSDDFVLQAGGDTYITLDNSADETIFSQNTKHNDSVLAYFGSDNDANIEWDETIDTLVISSNDDVTIVLDDNNNSSNEFKISVSTEDQRRFIVNERGNVALGTEDLESWSSSYRAIEIGGTSLMGRNASTNQDLYISTNAYYDDTSTPVTDNFHYKGTDVASQFYISQSRSFVFQTAPSGTADDTISWTTHATIDTSGLDVVGDITVSGTVDGVDLATRTFPRAKETTSSDVNWRFRAGGSSALNKEGISFSRFDAGYYGIFNDGSSTYGKLKIGYTSGTSSTTALDSTTAVILIDRTSEVEINTSTLDLNGILDVSGTANFGGVANFNGSYIDTAGYVQIGGAVGSPDTNHVHLGFDSTNGVLKIETDSGDIRIGRANTSFAHFFTDSTTNGFYFERLVQINGNLLPYGTAGTRDLGSSTKYYDQVFSESYVTSSTQRLKSNIVTLDTVNERRDTDRGLEIINQLSPVIYRKDRIVKEWNEDKTEQQAKIKNQELYEKFSSTEDMTIDHKDIFEFEKAWEYGLIAEEVEGIEHLLKDRILTNDAEDKPLALDYVKLVPILIQAIKELKTKVDNLENN